MKACKLRSQATKLRHIQRLMCYVSHVSLNTDQSAALNAKSRVINLNKKHCCFSCSRSRNVAAESIQLVWFWSCDAERHQRHRTEIPTEVSSNTTVSNAIQRTGRRWDICDWEKAKHTAACMKQELAKSTSHQGGTLGFVNQKDIFEGSTYAWSRTNTNCTAWTRTLIMIARSLELSARQHNHPIVLTSTPFKKPPLLKEGRQVNNLTEQAESFFQLMTSLLFVFYTSHRVDVLPLLGTLCFAMCCDGIIYEIVIIKSDRWQFPRCSHCFLH